MNKIIDAFYKFIKIISCIVVGISALFSLYCIRYDGILLAIFSYVLIGGISTIVLVCIIRNDKKYKNKINEVQNEIHRLDTKIEQMQETL